jgi:hypothetical protein
VRDLRMQGIGGSPVPICEPPAERNCPLADRGAVPPIR